MKPLFDMGRSKAKRLTRRTKLEEIHRKTPIVVPVPLLNSSKKRNLGKAERQRRKRLASEILQVATNPASNPIARPDVPATVTVEKIKGELPDNTSSTPVPTTREDGPKVPEVKACGIRSTLPKKFCLPKKIVGK